MSRAKARKHAQTAVPSTVRAHALTALERFDFQAAREFAKTLFKLDPTAEHAQLLNVATVCRSRELRLNGRFEDAAAILRGICDNHFHSQELLAECATELYLAGDWRTAGSMAGRVTAPVSAQRVAEARFDAVVLHGAAGLHVLHPKLRVHAEQIRTALSKWSTGDDAATRELLAALPDEPVLHEWNLLVQGLLAYTSGGVSPLTNWQGLNRHRVPASIAAPIRASLDTEFGRSVSVPVRNAWKSADGGTGDAWVEPARAAAQRLQARDVKTALTHAAGAWRAMSPTLPQRDRIRSVLYWAVIGSGDEDDRRQFRRIFGAPLDDPHLARMQALMCGNRGGYCEEEQSYWMQYEATLNAKWFSRPKDLPAVRAVVWYRIGQIAESEGALTPDDVEWGSQLHCALNCYTRAIGQMPRFLPAHERLLELFDGPDSTRERERVASDTLVHFPDHPTALAAVAEGAFRRGKLEESTAQIARAVQVRPHDDRLQCEADKYYVAWLAKLLRGNRLDDARSRIRELVDHSHNEVTRARRQVYAAVVELRAADDAKAEEFIGAATRLTSRACVLFQVLAAANHFGVMRGLNRHRREFRTLLRDSPNVATLMGLTANMRWQRETAGPEPSPADNKLALAYVRRGLQLPLKESQWEALCRDVADEKVLIAILRMAVKEFPQNATFHVLVAACLLRSQDSARKVRTVMRHLMKARRLGMRAGDTGICRLVSKLMQRCREIVDPLDRDPASATFADPFSD